MAEILLINPKILSNVGMVVRLAACYGFERVWYTGSRLETGGRIPRELRMYNVQVLNDDLPLREGKPVAVEVMDDAELLPYFAHPDDADTVYVFGPEDGSIPKAVLALCHQFVTIPGYHCLNLATAVATVLYDRAAKQFQNGDYVLPVTKKERV